MCGAGAWVWTLVAPGPQGAPILLDFDKEGIPDPCFATYIGCDPGRGLGVSDVMVAIDLNEISELGGWGTGRALLWSRSVPGEGRSTIAFFREAGAFSGREMRLANLLVTEIPWLHQQGWELPVSSAIYDLSPRLATVLQWLLKGASRKQIAGHLGISINTVHGYVKALYLHFGVRSHAALMQRCMDGKTFRNSPGLSS